MSEQATCFLEAQSEDVGALFGALAMAQAEMHGAAKDTKNSHLGSKYADLASVWDAWRPVGPKNKLAVVQLAGVGPDTVTVKTTLGHESGQWIRGVLTLPYGPHKGLTTAQTAGSALTYARRYALAAIVGVAPEDDDGNSAGVADQSGRQNGYAARNPDPPSEPTITDKDKQNLAALSGKTADWKLAQKTLLRHFRVDALGAIPAKCFPEAVKMLRDMAAAPTPPNEDADDEEAMAAAASGPAEF